MKSNVWWSGYIALIILIWVLVLSFVGCAPPSGGVVYGDIDTKGKMYNTGDDGDMTWYVDFIDENGKRYRAFVSEENWDEMKFGDPIMGSRWKLQKIQ